jgi:hypothetical protein
MGATRLGQAGLTGWRGKVGESIAKMLASRTHLTTDQARALVGTGIFLLTIRSLVQMLRRARAS